MRGKKKSLLGLEFILDKLFVLSHPLKDWNQLSLAGDMCRRCQLSLSADHLCSFLRSCYGADFH